MAPWEIFSQISCLSSLTTDNLLENTRSTSYHSNELKLDVLSPLDYGSYIFIVRSDF